MKHCPECNIEYENNINFCQKCGKPLEEIINLKTCPSCNAENPSTAKFCNECGESFKSIEYKCSKCGEVYEDNKFAFCPKCGGKIEEVKIKTYKQRLEELQKSFDNIESEKAKAIQQIQNEKNTLQTIIEKCNEKENELQNQLKSSNSEKGELRNKITQLSNEKNFLQQELDSTKEKLKNCEENLSQSTSLKNQKKENEQKKESSGEFVLVEGGTMALGSSNKSDRNPIHEVTLDSFYISKYQVTQKLYQSVMGRNPSKFKGDNRPVECVRWYDAVAFCNKLSDKEGLEPCYIIDKLKKDPNNKNDGDNVKWTVSCDFTKNGYRLPTEAEWEYAARGGVETCSYTYAGSNNLDSVGWYGGNSHNQTHDVGKKEPNELGLYDMSGNVLELCWDWYDKNIRGGDNPRGANRGSDRVLRGGSWRINDLVCAVSYRLNYYPYACGSGGGFRLVRSSSN